MKFYFITLFPELVDNLLGHSILKRAMSSNVYSYNTINPRDFATDKHKSVDDRPYGGGAGMVMRADVLEKALLSVFAKEGISSTNYDRSKKKVVVTSADGKILNQQVSIEYSQLDLIIFVCGHYEGMDQRFIDIYADAQISIGKYVLTGGELASLVMADSIVRLLPGALGSDNSLDNESFNDMNDGLYLEYPQYTRPETFNGVTVPSVLIGGNHQEIKKWRDEKSSIKIKNYKE
ncbi:MAG: tRNA (guanosine(37)-N1)-methyltransferase TrmD [bacterium]|nr:tRNA (guanosine(37)-N1)-methyltransferase TrmD [bacterium]